MKKSSGASPDVIVLDSSVVLASMLQEPGGEVFQNLTEDFRISSLNLAEIAGKLTRRGRSEGDIRQALAPVAFFTVDLTVDQAIQAGLWEARTRRFGLSLGDRCCLALARELGATVYTTDRVWADLDLGLAIKVVR